MKQIVLFIIFAGFLLLPASILAVEKSGQEEIIQVIPHASGKSDGISGASATNRYIAERILTIEKDAQDRINALVEKIKSLTDRSKEPELQKEIEKIKAEIAAQKEKPVH